ncbi:phage major capsid protein [Qipengyuania sp. GH25]|uniref:Phage major capsid protein n=1 Tax=Qipengyuania pacifica TaxID=2860199 RepID=A0ABS7JBW2_9SPHN|nr:phage major capsid protein [Qipengyuania aerophila]MBX7487492.1 phage major capsid protein [Qipengyuania aerophila]
MDVNTPDQPTATATPIDPAEASFDIVARQESTEAAVADLRSDLDRVKARIGRAARPALGTGDEAAPEVKGFVDGYLRRGATQEIKSITAGVPGDGGYAVPRQIDAAIARQLTEISPIRLAGLKYHEQNEVKEPLPTSIAALRHPFRLVRL